MVDRFACHTTTPPAWAGQDCAAIPGGAPKRVGRWQRCMTAPRAARPHPAHRYYQTMTQWLARGTGPDYIISGVFNWNLVSWCAAASPA